MLLYGLRGVLFTRRRDSYTAHANQSVNQSISPIRPSAAATARAGLRSATSGSVAVPRTTSSLGDRSFAVAAPRDWNNLPSPLRRVDSVNIFKRQLKTFLFAQTFLALLFFTVTYC